MRPAISIVYSTSSDTADGKVGQLAIPVANSENDVIDDVIMYRNKSKCWTTLLIFELECW